MADTVKQTLHHCSTLALQHCTAALPEDSFTVQCSVNCHGTMGDWVMQRQVLCCGATNRSRILHPSIIQVSNSSDLHILGSRLSLPCVLAARGGVKRSRIHCQNRPSPPPPPARRSAQYRCKQSASLATLREPGRRELCSLPCHWTSGPEFPWVTCSVCRAA